MPHRSSRLTFAMLAVALTAGLLWALSSAPALAHHPMGGAIPSTFVQGLLSGFGHPIIGPDHLAFVLGVGILSALFARGYIAPLVFVGGTLLGCVVHLFSLNLPVVEPVIAVSVIAVGALVVLWKAFDLRVFAIGAAIAGVFHGYAYGESIIGAEPSPLAAYLIGFAIIQSMMALAAFFGTRLLFDRNVRLATVGVRVAGCLVAAVGLFFLSSAVVA